MMIDLTREKMVIIETYKHFTIYSKGGKVFYRNASFISARPKSVLSAKNLITRHIKKLSKSNQKRLKYQEFRQVGGWKNE